ITAPSPYTTLFRSRRRGAPRETTPMALQLSVQVAAWLHAEVVAGAPFERIQPVLARQGFDEVQVRRIYNAVLTDPDGFRAGFERVAAGQPPVGHRLPPRHPDAPVAAPGAPIAADLGHAIACDHGEVRVAFRLERPHVVLFDNVLTPAECDALVAEARPALAPAGVVDSERGGTMFDARRSSELVALPRG